MDHDALVIEFLQSATFRRRHTGLKDRQAVLRINARLRRLAEGNPGDVKPVGKGLSELRIDHGRLSGVFHAARPGCGGAAGRRRQAHAGGGHCPRRRHCRRVEGVSHD